MKRFCGLAGLALFVCVFAGSAVPSEAHQHTLKFSTGAFAVYRTSTGELCSPAEKLKFRLPHAGTLSSMTYKTAATHCSTVQLHVLLNGHEVAKTGVLPAGGRDRKIVDTHPSFQGQAHAWVQSSWFRRRLQRRGGPLLGRNRHGYRQVRVTVSAPRALARSPGN
jgi:hypothetical protein